MDLRMPGMAGLDVLKLIHANYPNLPVVLFTAQPDLNSAVEALRSGATDYLLKPLKPQALIERAQTILANQQKENRKREINLQIEALQTELKNLASGQTRPVQTASLGTDRFQSEFLSCWICTRGLLSTSKPLTCRLLRLIICLCWRVILQIL
jgi:DNA-binding NtrC family response regulator